MFAKYKVEPKKSGYPARENRMADEGKCKELYYFSREFRYTVLHKCHISSIRKHENYRETCHKKRTGHKILRIVIQFISNFPAKSHWKWQSCYTLKVLGEMASRESWCCFLTLPQCCYYKASSASLYLHKRNDYNMEAVCFARILWVSGHTKRLTVNI